MWKKYKNKWIYQGSGLVGWYKNMALIQKINSRIRTAFSETVSENESRYFRDTENHPEKNKKARKQIHAFLMGKRLFF